MVSKVGQSRRPKTGGRKAGTPNKITSDLKQAILNAFTQVGGEAYLNTVARENPAVFCTLLGKVLPTQITGDLTISHEDKLRALR